jgi:hypothetical protein
MSSESTISTEQRRTESAAEVPKAVTSEPSEPGGAREFGGRKSGLDPTRYGDWEKNGRCIDF